MVYEHNCCAGLGSDPVHILHEQPHIVRGVFITSRKGASQRIVSVRPHRDRDGAILGVVATMHEALAIATEKSLEYANDALTGLAGRHCFMKRVRAAIAPASGPRRPAAVFLLDIENFQGVNDLHGASSGDEVLRVIANRLLAGTRSRQLPPPRTSKNPAMQRNDMVARLGARSKGEPEKDERETAERHRHAAACSAVGPSLLVVVRRRSRTVLRSS